MSGINENGAAAGALPGGRAAANILQRKENFSIQQRTRAEVGTIVFVLFLAVFGFSAGRVGMAEASFFPCGVALLSAALRRNSLNLYLTVPVLAGILTVWHRNDLVFGDVAAIPICAIVFWLLLKSNLSDFSRMLLCVFIVMICRVSYAAATHQLYRFEPQMLLLEGVVMCGLYYLFHVFFSFANGKETFHASAEGGVASLTVVSVLFVCGLSSFGNISFLAEGLPETAGLLCTLFMGYELGISAGILSAASAFDPALSVRCASDSAAARVPVRRTDGGIFPGIKPLYYGSLLCGGLPDFRNHLYREYGCAPDRSADCGICRVCADAEKGHTRNPASDAAAGRRGRRIWRHRGGHAGGRGNGEGRRGLDRIFSVLRFFGEPL